MVKKPRKKLTWIILGILLILVCIRVALPYVMLRVANNKLKEMPDYAGRIEDIDLRILRGEIEIENFILSDKQQREEDARVKVPSTTINLSWAKLFKKQVVLDVEITEPAVTFFKYEEKPPEPVVAKPSLQEVLKQAPQFRIANLRVYNGSVRFKDKTQEPPIIVTSDALEVEATNFTNISDAVGRLASVDVTANVLGSGRFKFNLRGDPLIDPPEFSSNVELTNVDVTKLNPFTRAYGKFDFERGSLSLFSEAVSKDGLVEGYVKPLLERYEIANFQKDKEDDGFFNALWQSVIAGGAQVLKNQPNNRLGVQTPFSGRIDAPNVGVWDAVSSLLRNAFIQALRPAIDDALSLQDEPKKE